MSTSEKIFLSYSFRDLAFVSCVADLLRRQQLPHFFYTAHAQTGDIAQEVRTALTECTGFVFFRGARLGSVQRAEVASWYFSLAAKNRAWVALVDTPPDDDDTVQRFCHGMDEIRVSRSGVASSPQTEALACAREIARRFFPQHRWQSAFNLPDTYLFAYEKDIIDRYAAGGGVLELGPGEEHCPTVWPAVSKAGDTTAGEASIYWKNPLPKSAVGSFRNEGDVIVVDARAKNLPVSSAPETNPKPAASRPAPGARRIPLTFPEAGPRESICFPPSGPLGHVRVGILVSGGIAPGINAVVRGIVNRHILYARPPRPGEVVSRSTDPVAYALDVYGITSGFRGLLTDGYQARRPLCRLRRNQPDRDSIDSELHDQAQAGGSILRTSRADELLSTGTTDGIDRVLRALTQDGNRLDILYVIGGDGSMRAAHAMQLRANELGLPLSVVAVPKTMDNDVLWVWQSFGFLSAVERAREVIADLHVEARSNPRVCVVQLFGSDSGFVASHAALASGVCDYVLVPEVHFSMATVVERVIQKLELRHTAGAYCMVVMAETAIPRDYERYLALPQVGLTGYPDRGDDPETEFGALQAFMARGGRVRGQTPDALRSAALKITAGSILAGIHAHGKESNHDYWKRFRVFANEPRHLIRAIPPSAADVIFGERLGALAVDAAIAGYSDCMVSQWLTEFVLVPLSLVVLGRKRVPPRGFFWRSVLASTGQPDEHDRLHENGATAATA